MKKNASFNNISDAKVVLDKTKKEILENLKNTYCRIKISKIEGVGIFAIRDIPKNTNPFYGVSNQRWHEFETSELKNLDKEVLKMIDDFWIIEKNGTICIPEIGLNGMDVSYFLNNSEKPNIKTIDDGINFVTMRKIKKGEELTSSYTTYDYKYI